MSQKLYTAAEARRIDKALRAASKEAERGEGEIYAIYEGNRIEIFFDETSKLWVDANNLMTYCSPLLSLSCWLPLTASLEASTPEPEQDCHIIPCTESENKIICAYSEKIEQLEKELAEREKTINIQKQTISNREQELDKLKWKQRWKSCKDEVPTTNDVVIFRSKIGLRESVRGSGYYNEGWALLALPREPVFLTDEQVRFWTWKYEADL